MDIKDEQIIQILLKNAKSSTQEISNRTGIPVTTVHNRIKRLEKKGIIKNYTVELDHEKLGKKVAAYILVSLDYSHIREKEIKISELAGKLKKHSSVEDVCIVSGQHDLLIKSRAENIHELNRLITGYINDVEGLGRTQTMVIMNEF
ncbi:winged helix-turn-helix transcriptional regulator [Candidatus Woesearchaeota archaeon]|nr:winged helix-turn-helix transcriptional regulator [Candidatus Woesearchaeota archaeon]